jgi:nitronate monooxygenase
MKALKRINITKFNKQNWRRKILSINYPHGTIDRMKPPIRDRTLAFCDALRIKIPIIQAPMAGLQASAMTIAVCNAGGLGSLPTATLSLEALDKELKAIKLGTQGAYNVNFFVHEVPRADAAREAAWRGALAPYFEEHEIDSQSIPAGPGRAPFSHAAADIVEAYRPAVVSFHFGLPSDDLLARVRSWGSQIWSSATTLAEARWLEQKGVHAIIAQGLEAGGHRGIFLGKDLGSQIGSFALIPQIAAEVRVPVIAAGGIADATGVQAALHLGAAAAQIGTAYLLCHETTTSPVHRTALKSGDAQHTALTNLFTGRPARGIVNRLMRELGPICPLAPEFPLASAALAPLRAKAEGLGLGDFTSMWAGQNTSGCKEISAAALTVQLAEQIGKTI